MTDHKFTDDDVIKTLKNAKYKVDGVVTRGFYLSPETFNAVVDLIGRQEAEIESLKKVLNELKMEAEMVYKQRDAQKNRADSIAKFARAEAIKEFAERLKKKMYPYNGVDKKKYAINAYAVEQAIDCIAKEMTEGNHESQST